MGGDKENFAKPVQKTATQSSAPSVVHLPIRASSISTAVSHPGSRSISGGLHQLPGATAIKDHKLGGLKNRTLEARCLKSVSVGQNQGAPSKGSRRDCVPCFFHSLVPARIPWLVVASLQSSKAEFQISLSSLLLITFSFVWAKKRETSYCLSLIRTRMMAFELPFAPE